jgi:eukaryotic-like serine/threonine-protein kinase
VLFAFFWYGGQDVIQHYVLRFMLYWKGYTPLRYANFLDYAARLVLLQKVGGGYIFIHRLLLEHFAANKER